MQLVCNQYGEVLGYEEICNPIAWLRMACILMLTYSRQPVEWPNVFHRNQTSSNSVIQTWPIRVLLTCNIRSPFTDLLLRFIFEHGQGHSLRCPNLLKFQFRLTATHYVYGFQMRSLGKLSNKLIVSVCIRSFADFIHDMHLSMLLHTNISITYWVTLQSAQS